MRGPGLAKRIDAGPRKPASGLLVSILNRREFQCAMCAAAGMSNKEIAYLLGVQLHTVKDLFTRLYKRTKIRNRCELVARYVRESR